MRRFLGLDISTQGATLAILQPDGSCETHALQTPSELNLFVKPNDALVAEWTGAFAKPWLDTALRLTQHTYLYHPRTLHLERKIVGEIDKTDTADARALAKIAHLHTTNPYAYKKYNLTPYAEVQQGYKLRAIAMQAERYTRLLVKVKQVLFAAKLQGADIDLTAVERTIKEAEKHALQELDQAVRETCPRTYEALRNLYPSAKPAILKICAHIHPITRFPSPDALCRYAGLYNFTGQSGTLQKRTKAKPGNKRLRTALYQLALGARGKNSRWRGYYERLRKRGLSERKALNRVMSRMLREVYRAAILAETDGEWRRE